MARVISALVGLGASALLVVACSRKEGAAESGAPASSAAAPLPSATPAAAGSGALDSCLVGTWGTTEVTLKVAPTTAQGGANISLQVAASGASVIDFTSMSEIHAKSPGFSFDFHYSGKATGTLKTPSPGTLVSEQADYSALRVTATVKLAGAGSIPLFKDTPVSELAKMGSALAGMGKGLAQGGPAAAASATSPASPASGIDSSPVFSSSQYTCAGDSLRFHGGPQQVEWVFKRVNL